jgi:hypothetical protein
MSDKWKCLTKESLIIFHGYEYFLLNQIRCWIEIKQTEIRLELLKFLETNG